MDPVISPPFFAQSPFDTEKETFSLWLTGDEAAMERVSRSRIMMRWAEAPLMTQRRGATFYETPEHDLNRAGLQLALIEVEGERRQILTKTDAKTLINKDHSTSEIFLETAQEIPVLPQRKTRSVVQCWVAAQRDRLVPVLRLQTTRWQQSVKWQDSRIFCGRDRAKVVAWPCGEVLREGLVWQIELRLLAGKRADLFRFATTLATECGLRLVLAPYETRAMELMLAGGVAQVVVAPRYSVQPEASMGTVLQAGLVAAARQVIGNVDAVTAGQPAAIKQMRIGLRRIRVLARLRSRKSHDVALNHIISEAKQYSRILGFARDWDVFVGESLRAIRVGTHFDKTEQRLLAALAVRAKEQQRRATDKAVALVQGQDFARFCLDLGAYCGKEAEAGSGWLTHTGRAGAEKMLDREWARLQKKGADLASAPVTARHPLRLALKRFRYTLHVVRPLYDKIERKSFFAALSALQDQFGQVNDGLVARQLALIAAEPEKSLGAGVATLDDVAVERLWREGLSCSLGASLVIGWLARVQEEQAPDLNEAWQAFAALPPFWRKAE